jgi:uncharacterized protein (DUF488 family)
VRHSEQKTVPVFTIGHSTHPIEEFIGILKAYNIAVLVDIRSIPRSRYNPQFSREALSHALTASGITYHYMKDLGGLRRPDPDSQNTGWRNASFRGYADYMQTEAFQRALDDLMALAETSRVAIMCAEAVPWRCHRSLVGDALIARGMPVEDILSGKKSSPHKMTAFAQVRGDKVIYPEKKEMDDLFQTHT